MLKIRNKICRLSMLALSITASGFSYASQSNPEYIDIMNQTARLIEERLAELNQLATDERVLLTAQEANFDLSQRPEFSNDKYLSINGIAYPVTTNNTVSVPMRHWSDESAMRNLFNFLGDEWELSWSDGGVVFVNKKFGNYDYGNGCLLEYYPMASKIQSQYINRDFGLVRELESCFDGSLADKPTDEAERTNPHHFGVNAQFANFISIEDYHDQLITAHSPRSEYGEIANPVIGFYHQRSKTSEVISAISKGRPYKQINDIAVHGDKLFVSAITKHNRIDIFDVQTKEYLYSLAVQQKGSAKIKVSDQWIFVTSENGIAVYPNLDANKHEIKPITRFATLLETKAHSLEFLNDNLLLAVSNNSYTVFDLASLNKGAMLDAMAQGDVGFSAVDVKNNTLIGKQENRVAKYDINRFISDGYVFNEAAKAVYIVDHQAIQAKDLLLSERGFVSLTDSVISNVHSPKAVRFSPNASVLQAKLKFDALPSSAKVQKILQAGLSEGFDSIAANTQAMIHTRLIDANTVEITNFTHIDVENVDISIAAKDQANWALLTYIDLLPAYTRITLPITALNADKSFNTVDGSGVYNYTAMLSTMKGDWGAYGEMGTKNIFSSRFTSTTKHPLFDKLNKISANWDIEFIERTFFDPKEQEWTASNVKKHIELITNMAYLVSSDTFKRNLMNYKKTYGHDLQVSAKVLRSQEEYADFLTIALKENGFSNVPKSEGFEDSFGIIGQRGSTFGISEQELSKIAQGEYKDFARAVAEQLVNNYFLDCAPKPCYWRESHLQKLIIDTLEQMMVENNLPYAL